MFQILHSLPIKVTLNRDGRAISRLPKRYTISIRVGHSTRITNSKSNTIYNSHEIERTMHDILPISKPLQIDSLRARVKTSRGNSRPLRMLMDNVEYSDLESQSLKHKMQPGNSQTSKNTSRHNLNVHSKQDSKDMIEIMQISQPQKITLQQRKDNT